MDIVRQYAPWKDELNFAGLEVPIEIDKILAFERLNPLVQDQRISAGGPGIFNVHIWDFSQT